MERHAERISPSVLLGRTLRAFLASFVRACDCPDPLDVPLEGARLTCGRCDAPIRGRT